MFVCFVCKGTFRKWECLGGTLGGRKVCAHTGAAPFALGKFKTLRDFMNPRSTATAATSPQEPQEAQEAQELRETHEPQEPQEPQVALQTQHAR